LTPVTHSSGYYPDSHLMVPVRGRYPLALDAAVNSAMASHREAIEHAFGYVSDNSILALYSYSKSITFELTE